MAFVWILILIECEIGAKACLSCLAELWMVIFSEYDGSGNPSKGGGFGCV